MINEYKQVFNCPDCKTDFEKGDIVRCVRDHLFLADSMFDCGKRKDDIGIVTDITFYKDLQGPGMSVVICELSVYRAQADMTTFHIDKYIEKIA